LIEHTLTTSNVFRTACFNLQTAEGKMGTDFCHMYALVTGLARRGGAVWLPSQPVIAVRARRAPAVDGQWPADLERSWRDYLNWQRDFLPAPELNAESAIAHVGDVLLTKLRKHPLRFLLNNLPALIQPSAYVYFFKRLRLHLRGRRDNTPRG
jgi:hypothetical protein